MITDRLHLHYQASEYDLKKIALVVFIILVNFLIFSSIFYLFSQTANAGSFLFSKIYYKKVLFFTIFQAVVSAFLCIGLGLWFLPSLFNANWKKGEKYFWSILNLPYFTPFLIGALAIIGLFGQNGVIAKIYSFFNLPYQTFLYGVGGIIVMHLFFYLPLTIKILRRSMDYFPEDNARLAYVLGFSKTKFWLSVVIPFLRADILRVFSLIALYCLRSFTTVLVFGGGSPATNTLEVALFQALQFESNQSAFAQIAMAQFVVNTGFFIIAQIGEKYSPKKYLPSTPTLLKQYAGQFVWIFILMIVVCFSLGLVFLEGLFPLSQFIELCSSEEVILCSLRNILLGLLVSVITLVFCFLLIMGKYEFRNQKFIFFNFEMIGYYTLIFSPLVLATSLFFILRQFTFHMSAVMLCILFLQVFSSLPSIYRILSAAYIKQRSRYDNLCNVLGIQGVKRFISIDWPVIKNVLGFCLASTLIFSLGDARSFLFFNISSDATLTTLLFEKIASHHFKEAASLATLILLLCVLIFYTISRIFGVYKTK